MDKEIQINVNDKAKSEETEEVKEDFPYISKELVDKLKDVFDIRKMIWFTNTREELIGIHQVITFLEGKYKEQEAEEK